MDSTSSSVNVFVALNCDLDVAYADILRQALISVSPNVNVCDVDELAVTASRGPLAHLAALNIPVFILSADSLTADSRRAFIAKGDPLLGRPSSIRRYYVCRDMQPPHLLSAYPELQPLANETMLVGSNSVSEVVNDLAEYLRTDEITGRNLGFRILQLIASVLLFPLEILERIVSALGHLLFLCGFLAGPILIILLLAGANDSWRLGAALLCLITAGMAIHNIDTLDVWPWLGPRWRAPPKDAPELGSSAASSAGSVCAQAMLESVLSRWRSAREWLAILRLCAFGPTGGPALVQLIVEGGAHWELYAAAFGCGLVLPVVVAMIDRRHSLHTAAYRGLTEAQLLRDERRVARYSVPPIPEVSGVDAESLKCFTPDEVTMISRWVSLAALSGICAFSRPWLRRRDRVFISYVWADDPRLGVAKEVSRALDSVDVTHYIDKRPIRSGFVGWRTNVAVELARATHLLLVVSPAIVKGVIVAREMRSILCAWFKEALPAVICVVDPRTAEQLRNDASVPLHLRFFLTWCPQLTPEEVRDPRLLMGVLQQRRRQGRLRDWWSLLWPAQTERSAAASLVQS